MKEYVLANFYGQNELFSTPEELTPAIREEICALTIEYQEMLDYNKECLGEFDQEIWNSSNLTCAEAAAYIFLRLLCQRTGLYFNWEKISLQCWPV
ncbi:MAG: hypothetical protein II117_00070 [Clostridia bacterium]|nr:hypothetical protein [Clostridia bacterium]